jgi:hypothetical protein
MDSYWKDISLEVPEPASLGLASLAAVGLIARRRRANLAD